MIRRFGCLCPLMYGMVSRVLATVIVMATLVLDSGTVLLLVLVSLEVYLILSCDAACHYWPSYSIFVRVVLADLEARGR